MEGFQSNFHEDNQEYVQISLHALTGMVMPQKIHFKGFIGKTEIKILVDRGSTYKFLQP